MQAETARVTAQCLICSDTESAGAAIGIRDHARALGPIRLLNRAGGIMHRLTVVRSLFARWPLALAGIWIFVIVIGLWLLWHYASTPAAAAQAPTHWPADTAIQPNSHGATLVMFAHPRCPCTRASIGELEKIVAHTQGRVTPWIVFYKPAQFDTNWERTDLWQSAAAIPGAHVISDPDGALARRFHALTSGQTVVYDAGGNLLFSGGITESRGHAGDNAGEGAVIDLLNTGGAACRESPVFGCALVELRTKP